jgi:hypothetical protein
VAIAGAWLLGVGHAHADGCFVFHWDKQKDINEPTQKAIILHDKGREDMVLQVKYEGPAEDFGWLIPVPGLPEVGKGSMDCFYELSRLTQRRFNVARSMSAGSQHTSEDEGVNVIKIKTVGAYEVAVLSATKAASLAEWLQAHHFAFPKEKQDVLAAYVKKRWYFVAARIDPTQDGFVLQRVFPKRGPDQTAIAPSTREKLANGELHPLVISFPSETCVFPLAISAVNGKSSEVSLYILSSEPLASRVIFDKKFAAYSREREVWIQKSSETRKAEEAREKEMDEWPDKNLEETRQQREQRIKSQEAVASKWGRPSWDLDIDPDDPPPGPAARRQLAEQVTWMRVPTYSEDDFFGGEDLVQSMEVGPKSLPDCSKEMPRLAGKSWWLSKQVQVFAPEEMRDLEFEPEVSLLAGKLGTAGGKGPAFCLSQLGGWAVPAVLESSKSSNPIERRSAAWAMQGMEDARLTAAVPRLLVDADTRTRCDACRAARRNWDATFVPRLLELLSDPSGEVRGVASECLKEHRDASQIPVYRKLVEQDGLAASSAISLLGRDDFSRDQLVQLFSSTNLTVVSTAFAMLEHQSLELNEIEPLLTNYLGFARMMGLRALNHIGDKAAVDRMVAMLRDPTEVIRWGVRARLRLLSGQKLGPDPAAYEKWWAKSKKDFKPRPPDSPGLETH